MARQTGYASAATADSSSIMIFIDASIEGQPPGYVRAIASKKT
jgi:hypothetical protein